MNFKIDVEKVMIKCNVGKLLKFKSKKNLKQLEEIYRMYLEDKKEKR